MCVSVVTLVLSTGSGREICTWNVSVERAHPHWCSNVLESAVCASRFNQAIQYLFVSSAFWFSSIWIHARKQFLKINLVVISNIYHQISWHWAAKPLSCETQTTWNNCCSPWVSSKYGRNSQNVQVMTISSIRPQYTSYEVKHFLTKGHLARLETW